MSRKLEKMVVLPLAKLIALARPGLATHVQLWFYTRHGMRVEGTPNYVSTKIWFDGTDYSLIELGDGCTMSSYIRVLTHDWSPHTVLRSLGLQPESPVGRISGVRVGRGAFVGTGTVIMPGCDIGDHSIIGSGTVVRGTIPPYSLVVGSPGVVIGDVRDLLAKNYPTEWAEVVELVPDQDQSAGL